MWLDEITLKDFRCFHGEHTIEFSMDRSLLQKAANKTLRSRLSSVRSTLKELKREREKAPGRLDAANKRLAEARHEISAIEAELGEISDKLSGIDFDEIAERERRRNELRGELDGINRQIGALENNLRSSEASKANKERELNKLLENDEDVLAIDFLELGKRMHPGDDRTAEVARGLQPLFEGW